MKRYRVVRFDFDTRAHILTEVIQDHWEEHIKDMHRTNKRNIVAGLAVEFGEAGFDQKVQNFIDIGTKPFSIVAYHNKFFEQARRAFIVGAFYPSLTATCALRERILNHLMLLLREDFRASLEYKLVCRKDSFDNWELPIKTLNSWNVLRPTAADRFRELARLRNRHAIHFHPDTENNERSLALEAIRLMTDIITNQFAAFGPLPWFLTSVPGENYIKKESESEPFVCRVYLPNCLQVGPYHVIECMQPDGKMVVCDDAPYEDREISDDEFSKLRQGARQS
jgi:hypothetical protein